VQRSEVGMFTGEYVDRDHAVGMQPISRWTTTAATPVSDDSGPLSKATGARVAVR
jgi:hypothetical protein